MAALFVVAVFVLRLPKCYIGTIVVFLLYGCPSVDPHLKRNKTMSEKQLVAISIPVWTDFFVNNTDS